MTACSSLYTLKVSCQLHEFFYDVFFFHIAPLFQNAISAGMEKCAVL